jgi:hypothetical protein
MLYSRQVHSSSGRITLSDVANSTGDTVSVVIADFDGDGKPDIAVTHRDSHAISVFRNKGNAIFQDPIVTAVPSQQIASNTLLGITAGDFNQDGKTDLMVTGMNITREPADTPFTAAYRNVILLGNGDGTFREGPAMPDSPVPAPSPAGRHE